MKKLFALFSMLATYFIGCTPATDSKKMDSSTIADKEQRIENLKKVVKLESDVLDAEYQLFNANGFASEENARGIPAPSFWDYKFAVKINPKNEMNWTNGLIEVVMEDNYDTSWATEITAHRAANWQTKSKPQFAILKAPGLTIEQLTYVEEGVIFRKVVQE